MYISPLLLLMPEFAADYTEENEQLFDTICLRKYEELNDAIATMSGLGHLPAFHRIYTYIFENDGTGCGCDNCGWGDGSNADDANGDVPDGRIE